MTSHDKPELDGVRGLAAYIVVISHISNITGLWDKLLGVGGGQLGVMLFFVLSGYLIGALYLDQPCSLSRVWTFAIRRFARIAPLYVAGVLAAYLSLSAGRPLYAEIDANAFWRHLALIEGQSVFWTVPISFTFMRRL